MVKEYLFDASAMEPPEPLIRALELIDDLKAGDYLRFQHRREPFPLYDNLNQRGFSFITCTRGDADYEVFIWNKDDTAAQSAIQCLIQADKLTMQFSSINNADS
ncbi:MAG: DUF2249 domain-containing protein [Gammaproteobacteria bacterium]|nr:DUF2249 domain-containing protein [Gammaproteobacteria bacterium]MCW8987863.1 DUF2249 domain-containing protein [Gammaproteobacteria bacterium]MCW9032336.1 DUF2249 domain-containing protein [Gammaproteobacteria bacterium]